MKHIDFLISKTFKNRSAWDQLAPDKLTPNKPKMQLFICTDVQPVALTKNSFNERNSK